MGLIAKEALLSLLSLDFTDKDIVAQFKKEFFMPAFENITPHRGQRSPKQFLADIEKLSSRTSLVSLGISTPIEGTRKSDDAESELSILKQLK
jgi:hypothetical protein